MRNFTRNKTRRLELKFLLSYVDDSNTALKIVHELVARDERVLEDPPPQIGLQSFADVGITVVAQVWTRLADYQSVQFDLNRAVKEAFDATGITMAFSQRKALLQAGPPAAPPRAF